MPAKDPERLPRECAVFCRYLGLADAPPAVRANYARGHAAFPDSAARHNALDDALLGFASRGAWATGVADSFAAIFRRDATLRLKLILLLAILENTGAVHERYDDAPREGRGRMVLAMTLAGLRWTGRLLVGVILFTPLLFVSPARRRHD